MPKPTSRQRRRLISAMILHNHVLSLKHRTMAKREFIKIEHLDNWYASKHGKGKNGVMDMYDRVRITYKIGGKPGRKNISMRSFFTNRFKELGTPEQRLALLKGRFIAQRECEVSNANSMFPALSAALPRIFRKRCLPPTFMVRRSGYRRDRSALTYVKKRQEALTDAEYIWDRMRLYGPSIFGPGDAGDSPLLRGLVEYFKKPAAR